MNGISQVTPKASSHPVAKYTLSTAGQQKIKSIPISTKSLKLKPATEVPSPLPKNIAL